MKTLLLLLMSAGLIQAYAQKPYSITTKGVVVRVSEPTKNGASLVRLEPITDSIIRVTAVSTDSFPDVQSLMIEKKDFPEVKWIVDETNDHIVVKTSSLHVRVSLKTGALTFCDQDDRPILTEVKNGGKTIEPVTVEGENLFSVRDRFESPKDEAFYGLGQQQEGLYNYKGHDVDLYQYNTKISIPFVLSSKDYGILWDNYSRTKFGDIREYGPLSTFKLYDSDGKEGGLKAMYLKRDDSAKVFTTRNESEINYEFIPDLKKFPAGYSLDGGKVTWGGALVPDSSGLFKFRLYSSGYSKLWIDNKLITDRWRQSWNAFVQLFDLNLQAGHRYPIRIEWIPDGGEAYISLKVKTPLLPEEQNELSLYSEYGSQLDYYFIRGSNLDDVVSGYRRLTGKAFLAPKWSLGFWQSRERYQTQDQLLQVANEYRKLKIPFDNIVQDWFYWREDQWGSMEFDSARYPNPLAMVDSIRALHEHIMVSVWAKFYKGIANFDRMMDKGYLYKGNLDLNNRDWVGKGYLSTFYDALNPDARKLFWKMIDEKLYPFGFDAWWIDSDEPDMQSNLPMETRKYLMDPTALGPGAEYFNAYALEHCRGVYDGLMSENPDKRVFILSRSAYAGSQRYNVAVWSGDIGTTWQDMKGQIPAGLNLAMSGLPYWTFDIGGFAVESKFINAKGAALDEWRELLTRWYEFGAFCPLYRSHGQYPFREIFNVAPAGSRYYDAMVNVTKMRYQLMPYIYSLAGMVYFDDYTIMRGLVMDFPNDKNVTNLSNEYLFGPSILVAPVTDYEARTKQVYLPSSCGWYDLYTGKHHKGGRTLNVQAPLDKIPLFVREGSIIPVGPDIQYAEEKTDGAITIFIYAGKDGRFTFYEDENENNDYLKGEYSTVEFQWNDRNRTFTIEKRNGEFPGMRAELSINVVLVSPQTPKGLNSQTKPNRKIKYTGSQEIVRF
ncbi:MAG TPA: TIM-barrel domain-containing protein [Candidatus Kryptonia bacterium]